MKGKIIFVVTLFIICFMSVNVFAASCPGSFCVMWGDYTWVSTKGQMKYTTWGNIGYGGWSWVTEKSNPTSCSEPWSTYILMTSKSTEYSAGLQNYFGYTNKVGETYSEYISTTIPPVAKAIVERRTCTQYIYHTYDLKCEFWDEQADTFVYTTHASNVQDYQKDTWQEHRVYTQSLY